MTIKIVGVAPPQRYRVVCTYAKCRSIIEFDETDVTWVGGSLIHEKTWGIACPNCNEVIPKVRGENIGDRNGNRILPS